MISRYLIGVVTGWVSLGGGYGLARLTRHYAAGTRVPPSGSLPECRALGPPGGGNCIELLGHRFRHRNADGLTWAQREDSSPPPRNTNRATHRPSGDP